MSPSPRATWPRTPRPSRARWLPELDRTRRTKNFRVSLLLLLLYQTSLMRCVCALISELAEVTFCCNWGSNISQSVEGSHGPFGMILERAWPHVCPHTAGTKGHAFGRPRWTVTWDREGGRSRTPELMLGTEACWQELAVLDRSPEPSPCLLGLPGHLSRQDGGKAGLVCVPVESTR